MTRRIFGRVWKILIRGSGLEGVRALVSESGQILTAEQTPISFRKSKQTHLGIVCICWVIFIENVFKY